MSDHQPDLSRRNLLLGAPFLIAHRVLTPFIEAYFIVADRLAAQPVDAKIDKKKLTSAYGPKGCTIA